MQTLGGELLAEEMRADFRKAGLTDEVMRQVMPTKAHVRAAYEQMRIKDSTFGRNFKDLLSKAESDARFQRLVGVQPASVTVDVNRGERKAALPQQPVLRTAPTITLPNSNPELSRADRNSAAIQRMKEARGQRVA